MTEHNEKQYGVKYPDGVEDWNTRSWFGHIESSTSRRTFQEQYDLRLKQFGLPAMPVTFLTRIVTTSYGEAVVVTDKVEENEEE